MATKKKSVIPSVKLEHPDFNTAIIGITREGKYVYDYELMKEYLVLNCMLTSEEAIEYINVNTYSKIDYMGANAPVIVYKLQN